MVLYNQGRLKTIVSRRNFNVASSVFVNDRRGRNSFFAFSRKCWGGEMYIEIRILCFASKHFCFFAPKTTGDLFLCTF